VSAKVRSNFAESRQIGSVADIKQGLATADNDRFLRLWHEVTLAATSFDSVSAAMAKHTGCTWFPHSKGGTFRRWYGNLDYLVNWRADGKDLKNFSRSVIRNERYYFRDSLTWSLLSSGSPSFRYTPTGNIIPYFCPNRGGFYSKLT
jgi:hypothetical protein